MNKKEDGLDHHLKGQVLEVIGKPHASLAAYSKAILHSPNSPDLYVRKSFLLFKLGKLDEGMSCVDKGLRIQPNRDLYHMKANVLSQIYRYDEALSCYSIGVQKFPNDPILHQERAGLLQCFGRLEEALESYKKADQIKPSAMVCFQMGNIYASLGMFEEAVDELDSVLSFTAFENHGHVLFVQAFMLMQLGSLGEAVDNFDTLIDAEPEVGTHYYLKGLALFGDGREDESMLAYKQAVMVDPGFSRGYYFCGAVPKWLDDAMIPYDEAFQLYNH